MRKLISAVLAGAMVASMGVMSSAAISNNDSGIADAQIYVYDADEDLQGGMPVATRVEYVVVDADSDTVKPDEAIYIELPSNEFADEDLWKVKTDKGDDNARMISKISVVETVRSAVKAARGAYIKISLNDVLDAEEYKLSPVVTFTAKSEDVTAYGADEDWKVVVELSAWMGNFQVDGDEDWDAGAGGYIAKPTKDDDNEIIWHNENNDIARLTFQGDSDVAKYYPKLSTKWVDSTYSEVIGNADGFVLEFVGNPAISSTSRATLEIYNPYINDDDEYDVAVEDLRVYLADADGVLEDITDSCTLGTNEDDDEVITLRTRQLGTYVVTDGTAVVDNVVADDTDAVEEPSKTNPGTGF